MSDLTWEWTLASGATILARVDPATFVESVYLGQRLVSRSGAGGKPEGHTVSLGGPGADAYREGAPQELRLTFDPALLTFQLRANGQIVAPARAPNSVAAAQPGQVFGQQPARRYAPMTPPLSMPREGGSSGAKIALLLGVGIVIGAIVSVSGVRRYLANARAAEAPAGAIGGATGLLTVRYPAGFVVTQETKSSTVPATREDACPARFCTVEFNVVKLRHATRDEGVFVASFKMNGLKIGVDPWRVSNLLHDKFEDYVKLKGSDYVETDRQDMTCLGEPGAAVTGRFRTHGEEGTMWSCTFIRDGNAYWLTSYYNNKHAADEAELKRIALATELLGR